MYKEVTGFLEMEKCACKLLSFVFNVMILNILSIAKVFLQSNVSCFICETGLFN